MKLQIQNLSKSYKKQSVLQGISFDIHSGSICGLVGVNGAGKSTLMKIIYGLDKADSGLILYDGNNHIATEEIGALIEKPAIYMNLSAFDNLKTRALLYGISDERIYDVLELIGLSHTGKKKAGHFSLGMKQRLGLGMALLTRPKLLILDEPTNGLDPEGIHSLLHLLVKLKQDCMTILISSHQLYDVSKVAEHIILLHQGHIRYNQPYHPNDNLENIFFTIVQGGNSNDDHFTS